MRFAEQIGDLLGRKSLTRRLLAATLICISLAEILFFVPAVAAYRNQWLSERLNAALIASLALDAVPDHHLPERLGAELLARAGVLAVSRKAADMRVLVLARDLPALPAAYYDLDRTMILGAIGQMLETVMAGDGRIIRVSGTPDMRHQGTNTAPVIDIVIAETPLRHAIIAYAQRIFIISLAISALTAFLIFSSFNRILIKPIGRLILSMVRFRQGPEDATRVLASSSRADEIGEAERALAAMQEELRAALSQKSRLAALGAAMSKINHDLRNMLTTAQLFSDRMAASTDPTVQREVPKLMRALDRAIALTLDTLRYGRAEEPAPKPQRFNLTQLVDEVGAALPTSAVRFENRVEPGQELDADPDHVYRILLNLTRNAVDALGAGAPSNRGIVSVTSARGDDGSLTIEIVDDGPGIPARVQMHLFEPFASGKPQGTGSGTGLGLAISRELARAHGGDLQLVRSDDSGTVFRVTLPDRAHFH